MVELIALYIVCKNIGAIARSHGVEAKPFQRTAFGLKELDWITTAERGAVLPFEAHIARPEVALVVLAMRWSGHAYGEVLRICDKHGKPLVRILAGYEPDHVARQILEQCGERLQAG